MSEIELSSGGGKEKNLVAENELLYEAVQAVEHENEELRALKQSLHDEVGAANMTIADLRGLLIRAVSLRPIHLDSCECERCCLKRDINAVLSR